MPFHIDDRVVYPAFGVGRIVGLVTKSFDEDESRLYYEVRGERSTAWVQVEEVATRGLRPLTRKDELEQFRSVLRGRPVDLNADFRQRQSDLRHQLKQGTFQAVCEMVRDLNGHRWRKPLNEGDLGALRKSSDAVYQEWAAADSVSLAQATQEVNALLQEARQTYQA